MIQNPVFRGFNPDPVYAAAAMIIMWRYHHLNGFPDYRFIIQGILNIGNCSPMCLPMIITQT